MMRAVQRRRLLNGAHDRSTAAIQAVVYPILQRRFKVVKRSLRRANLRKRLTKNLQRYGGFFKQDDGSDEDWLSWIDDFDGNLRDVLSTAAEDMLVTETKFWTSRALRPDPVDPGRIVDEYEARQGKQIKQIAEDTKQLTLSTVTDWYNTDASLRELIDSLDPIYGVSRAETIARTESTYITSQVSYDMMNHFAVPAWNWDLADEDGEWPCEECIAKADGGPYAPDDDMPPLHPRDRCGVVYANADGTEMIYGQ